MTYNCELGSPQNLGAGGLKRIRRNQGMNLYDYRLPYHYGNPLFFGGHKAKYKTIHHQRMKKRDLHKKFLFSAFENISPESGVSWLCWSRGDKIFGSKFPPPTPHAGGQG